MLLELIIWFRLCLEMVLKRFENDDRVLADVSTEIAPEEKMTLLDNNRAVDLSI